MKGSGSSQTDATAFSAGNAQMQPSATVRNGRGVPQHYPRLRAKEASGCFKNRELEYWNDGGERKRDCRRDDEEKSGDSVRSRNKVERKLF